MLDLIGFGFIFVFGAIFSYFARNYSECKALLLICGGKKEIDRLMRMFICPYFIWSGVEFIFMYNEPNFMLAKLFGLVIGLIVLPSFCFSYRVILKKKFKFLDVLVYVIAAICAQMFSYQIMISNPVSTIANYASLVILLNLFLIYIALILAPTQKILSRISEPAVTNKKVKK